MILNLRKLARMSFVCSKALSTAVVLRAATSWTSSGAFAREDLLLIATTAVNGKPLSQVFPSRGQAMILERASLRGDFSLTVHFLSAASYSSTICDGTIKDKRTLLASYATMLPIIC